MKFKFLKIVSLSLVVTISSIVNAGIITTEKLTNSNAEGTAFDSVTGKYYSINSYVNSSIHEFNTKHDFENGIVSNTISLPSSIYGTYFEVIDGQLYTRLSNNNNTVSVIELSTGAVTGTETFSSLDGRNYHGGFNWGGYSSMNFASDADSLYLFGQSSTTDGWNFLTIDNDLNLLSSVSLDSSISQMGWGFVAGGYYFSSSSYSSSSIDYKFDLSTGLFENVDLTFDLGSPLYLRNFDYNSSEDTLYISNYYDGLSKVSGITAKLGLEPTSVPEPSTLAILGLGIIGLGARRFKRRS